MASIAAAGEATNDFDWSTLGPHSAESRDALYHFAEARFGLSRLEVKTTLGWGVFAYARAESDSVAPVTSSAVAPE